MTAMAELPAELLDETSPHADIHLLFQHYDSVYFDNALGATRVEWSSGRMTSCAGTCARTEWGDCVIRLSKPILVLRPEEDLKNTLLHEMIHAYIMLLRIPGAGKDGHGPPFKAKMALINSSTVPDIHRPPAGYDISVYHTMLDEVRHYQQHWWECQRCGTTKRRAMNRPPQPADCFTRHGDACQHPKCSFHVHQRTCGGQFIKTREPPPKAKAPKKGVAGIKAEAGNQTIKAAFAQVQSTSSDSKPAASTALAPAKGVAIAALAGSVRRRPAGGRAQPSIAQFAQMAPRKRSGGAGGPDREPAQTPSAEVLVDLTADASDDDTGPRAAPAVQHAARPLPRAGTDQARCDTAGRSAAGDAAGITDRSQQGADAGPSQEPGPPHAYKGGEHAPDCRDKKRRRTTNGPGAYNARAPAEARLHSHVDKGGVLSSESAGVAIVDVRDDDAGAAQRSTAARSAEDLERRERRARCAAAAERRQAEAAMAAALAEAQAAGTPDPASLG
eukprot:jgi/Ulvmu1/9321/UM050_0070.1